MDISASRVRLCLQNLQDLLYGLAAGHSHLAITRLSLFYGHETSKCAHEEADILVRVSLRTYGLIT